MPLRVIALVLLTCASRMVFGASEFSDDHLAVSLVAETLSLKPGGRHWVGIKIVHRPEWHTYWVNPGDSGLPTRLEWQLPPQFSAGAIAWPAPKRFDLGGLYNFGYDGTVLLPVPIDVPGDASTAVAALAVTAKWLVCSRDICLPGKADLGIQLPLSDKIPSIDVKNSTHFANARMALPRRAPWQIDARLVGERLRIELRGASLPLEPGFDVFPITTRLVASAPASVIRGTDRLVLEFQRSEYLETIPASARFVLTRSARGERLESWQIEAPLNDETVNRR